MLIGIVAVYACVFLIGGWLATGELYKDKEFELFVQSNGVHTDFVMPVRTNVMDWPAFIPLIDFPAVKNPSHISIGWGDKGFFLDTPTWNDLTFKTAFNAAFLPSETAMHVAYHNRITENENRVKVRISKVNYKLLFDYILNSFNRKTGKVDLIPNRGYWDNDNFYEANNSYHLFKTCNSWTNTGLKLIRVKTGVFALTADGIMRHLKK